MALAQLFLTRIGSDIPYKVIQLFNFILSSTRVRITISALLFSVATFREQVEFSRRRDKRIDEPADRQVGQTT